VDFHAEFRRSLNRYRSLDGLVFADPDGEAVLFERNAGEPFILQLAGAKMPILMDHYRSMESSTSAVMEIQFEDKFVISVRLAENYSVTAIGSNRGAKGKIKDHLRVLAQKLNREIV
jgi:hypothetical protein